MHKQKYHSVEKSGLPIVEVSNVWAHRCSFLYCHASLYVHRRPSWAWCSIHVWTEAWAGQPNMTHRPA